MKRMVVLALALAMVLTAAAGVCQTLKVGMECNYAPYNWTQSEPSEDAVAIAAGGYADGRTAAILRALGRTAEAWLDDNDAWHALAQTGGLLRTGPTGTNVNDLSVLLIGKPRLTF